MQAKIAVLAGDGIGPDVNAEAIKVLDAVASQFGHDFDYREGLVGGVSIDAHGVALTDETFDLAKECDALLLGAIGGPKWDDPRSTVRPEQGLLALRKRLGLFANLRPVQIFPGLASVSTIREQVLENVDLVVVRELTGGLYFGQPSERYEADGRRSAVDTMAYDETEVARVVRVACELSRKRRHKVTSVDKANVLSTSRLWREVANEIAADYPDVEFEDMLVDSAAMRLIRDPSYFDVIVTENTFGDIITDEASMLAGSMGMLPSASLGDGKYGMYEPIHGSAPRRAGQNLANPIAMILSAAMLLQLTLGLEREAKAVEHAVVKVVSGGHRTYDIMGEGCQQVGTREMGDLIASAVEAGDFATG